MNELPFTDDERLDRVVEALQQINVQLEGLRVSLNAVVQATSDHELRLREIERWRYHLSPLLAALTFILGAIFTVAIEKCW